VAKLPKGKLKLLFGLMPEIPDPVPDDTLDLSVANTIAVVHFDVDL
jgi:hypothetical protein